MDPVLISLNAISKYFGRKLILKDINLEITAQSTIALLGPNGSGKSTLLKIIAGLAKISAGAVDYAPQLKIAYIPENFPKIDLTAGEFIKSMGLIGGILMSIPDILFLRSLRRLLVWIFLASRHCYYRLPLRLLMVWLS